jgi:hypothetical protein
MGYTACMGGEGGRGAVMPTAFLRGKGVGKRLLGRAGRRREDDINMYLK